MILSFVRPALRNLLKHRFTTLVNLSGLALGIACSGILVMHVLDEVSYDGFHPHPGRLFRVALDRSFPTRSMSFATSPVPMAEALVHDFPEVEASSRIFKFGTDQKIERNETHFYESNVLAADSNFFDVFGFALKAGDPATALLEPRSIVLTASAARRYFGSENPLGGTLILNDTSQYEVTGVLTDDRVNSHIAFDFLISLVTFRQLIQQNVWVAYTLHNYVVLKPGADPKAVEQKFPNMVRQYAGPQVESYIGKKYDEYVAAGNVHNYFLQPIEKIHLHSNLQGEIVPNSDIRYVWLFVVIACFILAIACINYINLTTAQAATRAKEIGVRKALGSPKQLLVIQFLVESVLLCLLAHLLAFVLMVLFLPVYNDLAGKSIELFAHPVLLVAGFTISITLLGLAAGTYPAAFLSSFNTLRVLKGQYTQGKGSLVLRNTLVVTQFSVSILLVVLTLSIGTQIEFMLGKDMGFRKDRIIVVDNADFLNSSLFSFVRELQSNDLVDAVSMTANVPGRTMGGGTFEAIGKGSQERFLTNSMFADYNLVKTLGLKIVQGRDFSVDHVEDTVSVLINEAAARMVDWDNPIGQEIRPINSPLFEVIGVVKDFHYASLHEKIAPLVIYGFNPERAEARNTPLAPSILIAMKNGADASRLIPDIATSWSSRTEEEELDYGFLAGEYDQHYRTEERFGKMFQIFSALTILIGVVGVFGLSAFITQQRFKEIGIRKVLGASVIGILALLSRYFVKLGLLANLLALPLAYFGLVKWLESYPYRADIDSLQFITPLLASLLLLVILVSLQSLRAATTSPIKSIRYE